MIKFFKSPVAVPAKEAGDSLLELVAGNAPVYPEDELFFNGQPIENTYKSNIGLKVDTRPTVALCVVYNPWCIDSILSAALLVTKLSSRRRVLAVSSDKIIDNKYVEYLWVGVSKSSRTARYKEFDSGEHVFLNKPVTQAELRNQESIYSGLLRKYGCATDVSNDICDLLAGFYRAPYSLESDNLAVNYNSMSAPGVVSKTKAQLVSLWSNYRLAVNCLLKSQVPCNGQADMFTPRYTEQVIDVTPTALNTWDLTMRALRQEIQGTITRTQVRCGNKLVTANVTNWGTSNYPWKARMIRMMDTPHVNFQFTPQGVVLDTNLAGVKLEGFITGIHVVSSGKM